MKLVNFIEKELKCALVGDFNAKTAVLEDFSEPDEIYNNNTSRCILKYFSIFCKIAKTIWDI
jgi:UDP-glucose 4-epimerase